MCIFQLCLSTKAVVEGGTKGYWLPFFPLVPTHCNLSVRYPIPLTKTWSRWDDIGENTVEHKDFSHPAKGLLVTSFVLLSNCPHWVRITKGDISMKTHLSKAMKQGARGRKNSWEWSPEVPHRIQYRLWSSPLETSPLPASKRNTTTEEMELR